MRFLSKIFSKPKEATIEDYMKHNRLDVTFSKLYYTYPEKRVPFEGQIKEYTSFDDFVKDFPHLIYHKYELGASKYIKVSTGYFFHFRGWFYQGESVEDCLSNLIGKYVVDDWYSDPKDKCLLVEKKFFNHKFNNANCFMIELGGNYQVNAFSISGKGVVHAKTDTISNKYSTVSIGDVDNKPIVFGDKIPLINISDHVNKGYITKDWLEHDVPSFFEIYYGLCINHDGKDIPIIERLLRKDEVVVDFLKFEEIDVDKYLDNFKKQSRKRKLEKIMRINNEI